MVSILWHSYGVVGLNLHNAHQVTCLFDVFMPESLSLQAIGRAYRLIHSIDYKRIKTISDSPRKRRPSQASLQP